MGCRARSQPWQEEGFRCARMSVKQVYNVAGPMALARHSFGPCDYWARE